MQKIIKNFPNYSITDTGNVINNRSKRLLKFSKSLRGNTVYLRVTLFKHSKRYYYSVHKLVAEAFIKNPNNLPQVYHIDGNASNNKINNLKWVTASENIKESFILNPEQKKKICSIAGKAAAIVSQTKAKNKYKQLLGKKFISFIPGGILIPDAAVSYICKCGVKRTASVMWKELRKHSGKCPKCTNTINRSSNSLR